MAHSAPPLDNSDSFPSEIVCPICFGVPLNPSLTECEHIFCKECLEQSLKMQPSCPICRESCHSLYDVKAVRPGTALYRIWSGILVKCPNHDECSWTGTISQAARHVYSCTYSRQTRILEKMELLKQIQDLFSEVKDLTAANFSYNVQVSKLKSRIKALKKEQRLQKSDHGGPMYYNYDVNNVVELSQLISRHLEDKPRHIDASRIFNCVNHCYSDYKRGLSGNPMYYEMDMKMLLATCGASTWFSSPQLDRIYLWLEEIDIN